MDSKTCTKCGESKRVTEFYHDKSRKDGLHYWCKVCGRSPSSSWSEDRRKKRATSRKLWKKKNPKKYDRKYERRRELKKYGLTPEEFHRLFSGQNGLCAICSRSLEQKPCVDHDHSTGKVRGILCVTCNLGLGAFKDSKIFLSKAIEYLE